MRNQKAFKAFRRWRHKRKLQKLPLQPLTSVLLPLSGPKELEQHRTIGAIQQQSYPNWELCIAPFGPQSPTIADLARKWQAADARIKVASKIDGPHLYGALNAAMEMAVGEFVTPIEPNVNLLEHALAEMVLAVNHHPTAQIIYSDQAWTNKIGQSLSPWRKGGWSADLFRAQNYLDGFTTYRADLIRAANGWRDGFEEYEHYDLALRLMETIKANDILHISKILCHRQIETGQSGNLDDVRLPHLPPTAKKALEEHLQRTGVKATVETEPPYYHICYEIPEPAPLVSLIIPTKDKKQLLEDCISSILEKTDYPNYEIIVINNDSTEEGTLSYLHEIARHDNIRVLEYPKPFNFSAINNFAVERAAGDLLALVNNDVEVISPRWLSLMVGHALRPEIGCVGAKLYYPDNRIQHAGVVLGLNGIAGHAHRFLPRGQSNAEGRVMLTHNVSAVTAACLVVRKEIYVALNGLDEINLPVAFNDVDFCLRVREAGYLNLLEPRAELYHHESVSRGKRDTAEKKRRFKAEKNYMKQRWGTMLDFDTYNNM